MLEFTLESPKRFLNEIVSLAEAGNTKRARADRRTAVAGKPSPSGMPRKRRHHDALYLGKPVPLEW